MNQKTFCSPVLIALGVLMWNRAGADHQVLTVTSWGGSYERACVKGYHECFSTWLAR